ncbi:MAG: hypothetical protein ACK46X_15540, partial [Candidatus Sericytochromatia bacterium]
IGANAALQFRPTPELELVIEGQYQRFETVQNQYNALTATAGTTPVAQPTLAIASIKQAVPIAFDSWRAIVGLLR